MCPPSAVFRFRGRTFRYNPPPMTSPPAQDTWTTRRLLQWMRGYFEQRELEAPRVVAEMLLAHVLHCDRTRLYMEADRPAAPDELTALRDLTRRAGQYEPVHCLIGEAAFYWRQFEVNDSTLIPQPCTEVLVDGAIEWARREPSRDEPLVCVDLGTGTGCIAISLAAHVKDCRVIATDISRDALALARRNAERHGVADRIEFRYGPTWEPFERDGGGAKIPGFDAVCSNPPYVPDSEVDAMDPSVREHIAETAWRGGSDGLDVIGPILNRAPEFLRSGGLLALECAHAHASEVLRSAASDERLRNAALQKDQDGLPRVLLAYRV